jgi:hypothetical protein
MYSRGACTCRKEVGEMAAAAVEMAAAAVAEETP